MPTINIQQWDASVQCRRGTILEAALASGVPFPHNCRSGECGSCKTSLLAGEVDHDPYDPAALSDAERSSGLILACRARPKTDIRVALLSEMDETVSSTVRHLKATVIALEHATHNVVRLWLVPQGKPLAFAAGQYARLMFEGQPPRPYSMANRPDESALEFHIRRVPNGQVSGYVAEDLRTGDVVRLEGPFGNSYLREKHQGPIVAVAGGTGLAPIRSIARTALKRMSARPMHIYLGVRDERDVYGEEELSEFAAAHTCIRTHIVLSEPGDATTRRTGFVHDAVARDLSDLSEAKIYVAGPPPMVNGVVTVALERGAARGDVHSDPFTVSPSPEERRPGRLRIMAQRFFGLRAAAQATS